MGVVKRAASSLLLVCGTMFVFAGLSAALGLTVGGVLVSLAAIAALLYAGGVWFGGAPSVLAPAGARSVVVFDRLLLIAAGAVPGAPLLAQFPPPLRPEIELRCRLALGGEHTHFDCEHAGARLSFDIAPVPDSDGMVLYGVLVADSGTRVAAVSHAPQTTVA